MPKLLVQRLDTLRRDLEAQRAAGIPKRGKLTPWREIAKSYPGVPPGTLCAVGKGREPHKPSIRAALGLPVTVPVAVCSLHGIVHEKRCPGAEPKPRKPAKSARRKRLIYDEHWRSLFAKMASRKH